MEPTTRTVEAQEIRELVAQLLIEERDIEPELVRDEVTLQELDLDSLDMVEIAQVVEQTYGVRIKAKDAKGLENLGQLIALIHGRIVAGGDEGDPAG